MVIDAGAGAIDIFCYRVTDTAPLQIEEVDLTLATCAIVETTSKGLLQGGDFVTARTRVMVSGRIKCALLVERPAEP